MSAGGEPTVPGGRLGARDVRGRLGVGLWTMQSTARHPAGPSGLYAAFAEDARLVEALGLHSVWTAEHRTWYDGWCPAPLHALAFVAARTSRVRLGTAMLLLPQHDAVGVARSAATLDRISGGRLELGVGLGYRDAEFDLLGVRRDRRGRRMEDALDLLGEAWAGGHGDAAPVQPGGPPLWIGGMAAPALERAARRGLALMLPQTVTPERLEALARRHPAGPGVGTLRDVHIERDESRANVFRKRLLDHYREEIGSWWAAGATPDGVERQLGFVERAALVGTAERVAEGLAALLRAGATYLVVRLNFDFVERAALHEQLAALAGEVAPRLGELVPGP